jgi:guanylate kinase
LRLAKREVTRCGGYDYLVVNDDLKETAETLRAIIRAERSRTRRQAGRASAIRKAFRDTSPPSQAGRRPS